MYTFLEHMWLSFKEAEESVPSPPPGPERSSGESISGVKRKGGLAAWWADNLQPIPPCSAASAKWKNKDAGNEAVYV